MQHNIIMPTFNLKIEIQWNFWEKSSSCLYFLIFVDVAGITKYSFNHSSIKI